MIIDGRKIRDDILAQVKAGVATLTFQPVFCDVLVGNDIVSVQYVRMKVKATEEIGILFHTAEFPETISENELVNEIKKLNEIQNMCGIILQLPLPKHLNTQKVRNAIRPELDLDCLGQEASNNFYNNNSIGYPAAQACMAILDSLDIDLLDKKILVMGQGELIGRPVTHLLKLRGLAIDTLNSATENNEEKIKNSDVIISGIGHGKYITGGMIKHGAIVIDAGTSESNGGPSTIGIKVVGDVDLESVENVASFVSPVPGGVGPVTIAMLLKNLLIVAENQK